MGENLTNSYKLEGVITAISPLTQTGDQKTGASQMLPTKDVWHQGDSVQVPFVSGNSVRGRLRRMIMEDLCEQLHYEFTNEHVWHAFFGGGQLQAIGPAGVIDLGFRKRITSLIPPVALWGFSLGNQVLESKMIVQDMDVLCEEMADYVPEKYKSLCTSSFYQFVSHTMFTRKDDRQTGGVKSDDNPSIQMKIDVEVLIPGTRFYHGFVLRRNPSPVEIACLHRVLKLWGECPTIGGKASGGYGRLKLGYEDGTFDDAPYLAFLHEHTSEIIALLDNLSADMSKKVEKAAGKKKKKATEEPESDGGEEQT